MAGRGRSGSNADQASTTTTETHLKGTRRKISLVFITVILNILLWSAIVCIAASLYQIVSDPFNTSSYAQVALTIISALVTIGYTIYHSILSLKQKLWEQQRRYSVAMKRNSTVPTRIAGSMCALWLLTSGWDMILVASTPVCLPMAPGLDSSEYGLTCHISRVGVAFAVISLVASIALLGILAGISRPFEAHLLNHGYQPPIKVYSKPYTPGPSDSEVVMYPSKQHFERPKSLHEIQVSYPSNTDSDLPSPEDALLRAIMSPPYTVFSPRRGSLANSSRSFVSGVVPGSTRQSLPAHFSTATWRVAHPNPASLSLLAHSHPEVVNRRFSSYQSPYSRHSMTLTRPQRLSYHSAAPSVRSQSDHTDSDHRSNSLSRGNSSEIARAFVLGLPMPAPARPTSRPRNIRITTTLDTGSCEKQLHRMSAPLPTHTTQDSPTTFPNPNRPYIRSASPGFLSFFSPDTSPVDTSPTDPSPPTTTLTPTTKPNHKIQRKPVPLSRRPSEAARAMFSNMPDDLPILPRSPRSPGATMLVMMTHGPVKQKRTSVYEEVKNKALPRIAIL
ncbi:hypothetical protein COCC4DRAFT_69719 [Bipolaris maydis ATCC 48331]|uniref:Uncharacterized protein n=2 Tax=Cochliobolus heterostrophus TaxID=5016 RepID=M2UX45_COCH5|nr:uncharacterized protein COCC4DRAFT_69719 [Bipolaris maydis ATCC 48331]EMD92352.1 hypothetical protein COCHEDRAFT_1174191 [Bipolaris maydis C5]ENI08043.1 hypothetical protein COCC4DRAFT_69719 [Bipolaris maydis ATCC 48331]KAJ6210146.1 hypothetical protein PSV09DRAFT_1174191 [Bipolaris maydis]KAJ6272311.1 hypothetical protein PSV08DRAFT_388775 [Bipolaris maydis]